MACTVGVDTFRLEANGTGLFTANERNRDICTATKILDRLHREFTEQYVAPPGSGKSVEPGKTAIYLAVAANPTFYLRNQPPLAGFPNDTLSDTTFVAGTGESSSGSNVNRLYNILNSTRTPANSKAYRTAVHAITYGAYNPNTTLGDYLTPPPEPTFTDPLSFKGIYGLKKLNDVLESKVINTVITMTGTEQATESINTNIDNATKYTGRQGIKTTLEEIARRENEIYREKFLHIMLVVVGIFLVSSQLVRKYFSFGGGGGGTSGGFGFGSGNLFTGFGLGSGSGLFSRFGGLGLGRSGRSRITSMFSNNPYSLSNR